MEQIKTLNISSGKGRLKLALWILLIAFAGKFIKGALPYFGFEEEVFGRYWDFKFPLIGHITGGLLAIIVGPFQFWDAFRKKYLTIHRWLGRMYLTAILIGALSSTYLAWTSALAIHWTWAFSLQILAFAWICTASMAYISILRGRIQTHKEWMVRSYVITFAFVTFRWVNYLPIVAGLGNFVERAPTVIWVSWVIPLLITDVILQCKKQ